MSAKPKDPRNVEKIDDADYLPVPVQAHEQKREIPFADGPDSLALTSQLLLSAYLPEAAPEADKRDLLSAPIELYNAMGTRDALKSIYNRLLVVMTQGAVSSIANAMKASEPVARETEMRLGIKCAKAFTELAKALDAHRGQGAKSVNVGQVNVEAGAQAIVGNVDHKPQSDEARGQAGPQRAEIRHRKVRKVIAGPHASAQFRTHASQPAVQCEDAPGYALPCPGSLRTLALPDAWRCQGVRATGC